MSVWLQRVTRLDALRALLGENDELSEILTARAERLSALRQAAAEQKRVLQSRVRDEDQMAGPRARCNVRAMRRRV